MPIINELFTGDKHYRDNALQTTLFIEFEIID